MNKYKLKTEKNDSSAGAEGRRRRGAKRGDVLSTESGRVGIMPRARTLLLALVGGARETFPPGAHADGVAGRLYNRGEDGLQGRGRGGGREGEQGEREEKGGEEEETNERAKQDEK